MIVPLMANADNDFFITEPIPEPEPEPPTVYLLRDEFTTTEAAPVASPRTAEPGPGSLAFVQTDGQFSISDGKLSFVAQTTPVWGDQGFYGQKAGGGAFARTSGVALLHGMTINVAGSGIWSYWISSAAIANFTTVLPVHGFSLNTASKFFSRSSGVSIELGTYATGTEYQVAIILRSAGAFHFLKGGVFANWTLVWVAAADSTAALYAGFANHSHAGTLDSFRVLNLGSYDALFATDYGIATDRKAGSVAAGTTFSHTANCIIEFVVTTRPSADNVDVFFRVQDASNYWRCRVTSAGNITLDEVVAGVATNRGSAAGVVSSGHRVVIIADGATIRGYSNNVLRWTYASAANFQAATSGELDALGTSGVVSDLISWPRTVSLPNV